MGAYDDWYVSSTELEQGSILLNLPYLRMREDLPLGSMQYDSRDANFVVLTQTCDIPKPAQRDILLAELVPYDVIAAASDHMRSSQGRKALAEGTTISEFLLPPAETYGLGWSVVGFRTLYVVPKVHVLSHGSPVAVSTPYREHLAQAYARFTMRVGLPSPLHAFKEYKPV